MSAELIDIVWVLMASMLVFVMQAGFAMLESGLTRSKNSVNVAVKNLTDFGVSVAGYWVVGFGLMFGVSVAGLLGGSDFLFAGAGTWPVVFFIFQAMFCSTSATIVSGAVAERMKYSSYIVSTVMLSVVVYPLFGHWAWGGALEGGKTGWLVKLGFVDFAGSTVVHSLGAWVALAILIVIGPRTGRFRDDGTVASINGSNIPMAVLGVFLLWFGWFGFNGGSTLALNDLVPVIVLNTVLAGVSGMLGTLALGWPLQRKPDVGLVLNGSLAGLVAITASCHAVSAPAALLIGAVGGMAMFATTILLEKLRIDDAVGAIPVHLAAGIWGTLAVALFGNPAILGTELGFWSQLGVQALGVLTCGAWAFGVAWLFIKLLHRLRPVRVSIADEAIGLNKAEHGVSTELLDLFSVLDHQSKTGDTSLRAPEEPFTEIGQIAGMYNNVMDKLESSTVAKDEYVQIMHNVGDGMFLLDRNRSIGPYYSIALETMFERSDLAGMDFMRCISGFVQEEVLASVNGFLDICFDPTVPWRNVERLNPLAEIEASFDNAQGAFTTKHFRFYFRRIEKEGKVARLLVLARDVTHEKELSLEVEKTRSEGRQEMEMLYRILHVEPAMLDEFLKGLRSDLESINEHFINEDLPIPERLDAIFRLTHAVKGDAGLLELDFIADKAELLEDKVRAVRARAEPDGESLLELTFLYSELSSAAGRLEELLGRWAGLHKLESIDGNASADWFASSLESLAGTLAARYGKQLSFTMETDENNIFSRLGVSGRKKAKDIVVQLLRNAVFHGIELPVERLAAGKNPVGQISLRFELAGNSGCKLIFRDDGRGLDAGRMRERAVESGLMSREKAQGMTDRLALMLMFSTGFSTAETVDNVAGKGVGMSLVKEIVRSAGGRIGLRSREGQWTEFTIELPMVNEPAVAV